MNSIPTNRLLLTSAGIFQPIRLATDDFVPASMVLVLVYPYEIEPSMLSKALERGLNAFPHLSGAITGDPFQFDLSIGPRTNPRDAGIYLEVVESEIEFQVADIEAMGLEEQFARFAPTDASNDLQSGLREDTALFQVRLTSFKRTGMSVMGLMASHMAIDGTGLALFLLHCTALIHGGPPPQVFHDRNLLHTGDNHPSTRLPHRYLEMTRDPLELLRQWDVATRCPLGSFTVSVDTACRYLGVTSIQAARFALTALLCTELANHNSQFSEIALWCDPRGTLGIPKTYTGNVGCYIHLPLRVGGVSELTSQLQSMATREGFVRIANTYRALKCAELEGRTVIWDGLDAGVLPVNLVPHVKSRIDFGGGLPSYGQMLTRNSHGIRLWVTPDGQQFVVETCLPSPLPSALIESCRNRNLITSVRSDGY